VSETLVAGLRCGGLSDRVIGLGVDQLILYVAAAAFEAGTLERSGMTTDEIERYYADVHAFYERLPPERFPALARAAPAMTPDRRHGGGESPGMIRARRAFNG
jgi:hypothetical protein